MSRASLLMLIASGFMNSSRRISPGWTGSSRFAWKPSDASVVVDDLDLECVTALPAKAEPPSVVDSNAVLPSAIAFRSLEPIARRWPEIVEPACLAQVENLRARNTLDRPEPRHIPIAEQRLDLGPIGSHHMRSCRRA